MITRPPTSSQSSWQVVPAGDKWRVINRGDLLNSDYKVFTYPGFNAAFSIDPVTGVHDIVFLEYPQAAYTKEELEDPNSQIGAGIKKEARELSYLQDSQSHGSGPGEITS